MLERLYAIFRLAPFGSPQLRALRKDRKHYHFDWSVVPSRGARFENLVACHLLKWVHYRQDTEGLDYELRYFRDRDGREVDFVVTNRGAPVLLVECKWSDADLDRGLKYLKSRFPDAEAWQISAAGTKDYASPQGIRAAPALKLLSALVQGGTKQRGCQCLVCELCNDRRGNFGRTDHDSDLCNAAPVSTECQVSCCLVQAL